jgi:DNA polymerase III epsilon subunit-like protein
MTPGEWLRYAQSRLGSLPSSYLVFDIETTGLDINIDLPAQIGWAVVENNKLVDSGSRFMNWASNRSKEDYAWLVDRVNRTKQQFEFKHGYATGNVYSVSIERMLVGDNPEKVLSDFYKLFTECRKNGFGFLAHNGLRHDQPIIDRVLNQLSGGEMRFRFKPNDYFDTLSIEKSVQIFPEVAHNETWLDFARRAYHLGGHKVKGSLDRHCSVKYDLPNKHNLCMDKAHEADFDCVLTHHLMQEYRELSQGSES